MTKFQPLFHHGFWDMCKWVQTINSIIMDFCGVHLRNPNHQSYLEGQNIQGNQILYFDSWWILRNLIKIVNHSMENDHFCAWCWGSLFFLFFFFFKFLSTPISWSKPLTLFKRLKTYRRSNLSCWFIIYFEKEIVKNFKLLNLVILTSVGPVITIHPLW